MSVNSSQNISTHSNHRLRLAVLAALPMLAITSFDASAACSGSLALPSSASVTVLCNGTGTSGNVTNAAGSTTYVDNTTTATAGNNTLIQFDGQGRTLINSADITNNRVITGTTGARGRTAILMGNATLNAGSGTVFSTNLPTAGVTTVTLNAAPTTAYVGQTIVFGRYNATEGDFSTGATRLITAVDVAGKTVTFSDALPADFAGSGTDPEGYKVVSNYGAGDNIITNKGSGTISSQILASEINNNKTGTAGSYASVSNTAAVKAISMSVEGNYVINNTSNATISVRHDGIGAAYGIEEGGTVTELVVNNAGTISAERTAALTLVTNSPTANPTATAVIGGNTYAAQTVALVNAINTQEEASLFELNNTGTIRATGDYAGAIYMRAAEKVIVNEGLIEYVGSKGFAIGAVSNPASERTLDLTNTKDGEIKGDILVTNGNALRWYLLSTEGGSAGMDSRLNINNQYGQSDSVITNAGEITGNFYYSNGTHELTNSEGGTITGNIDLDQRNTYDAGGNGTLAGTKTFTFENAGTYSGNITARTTAVSEITLIPTVTGSGVGSTLAAPSTAISGMGGVLKVFDGTAATDGSNTTANLVTVAPKSSVTVHAGEYFKVTDSLYGSTLPSVVSDNTPLVHWSIATNAGGNLVIGVDSVASAATLSGVTTQSASVIDALMANNTVIGGAVQGLTQSADIEKAGQQLRPEANNASMQASMAAANYVVTAIDRRLDNLRLASSGDDFWLENFRVATNVDTGISPSDPIHNHGFWMQGFGFQGDQGKRGGVDGYTANTGGFAIGGDTRISNSDLRVGLALSYASTGVDGEGVNSANRTDINSYQGTLYGSWGLGSWYMDAELGYGKQRYDTNRAVVVGVVNDMARGSHDANQYLAKIGAGYPIKMGKVIITPTASLNYVHLDQDGYTESSSSGSALSVGASQTDSLRSGLGAKIALPLSEGAIKTALEARAIWSHEFADTSQDTTARFAAGGASFTTSGVSLARDSANVGLGLNLASANGQTLSVNYDAEVKSDYVGQTASVKFRYDF